MTETPYNNENNFDDFDIEAKREEWAREREERRVEEIESAVHKTEKFLPLYTILIFYCFFSLALVNREIIMEDALYYINMNDRFLRWMFLAVWFGSIGDTTRLAIHKHKPLLKFCIAIIFCAVVSVFAMLFSFTNLPDAMAVMIFNISRVFALAGAAFTIYPIKYAWTKKQK
ncbi:MAG: hypothetical protein IJN31_05705 [Peptococcaceae bacterium]|nr:hypothetical protein [Peptococcaceae bacterium]MBQ7026080.1 hypothetical protein [Peptococcaceae bacterium]